jgi:DNA-binding NarL/FixJ family response regulator
LPNLRHLIVFVLTTSKAEEDRVRAYGFNVAGYIVKSDPGGAFMKAIEMLNKYWRVVEFP